MGHTPQNILEKKILAAEKKVNIGDLYCHYKDPTKHYIIESVGIMESTEEVCVCYRALYDKEILWVRTLDNFLENIGSKKTRFLRVD